MITILIKNGEHIDSTLRKFKKTVEKTGLTKELRQRRRHEKQSKKKQRKIAAAIKRQTKRTK